MLDADRLLWVFRHNARLETPGEPYIGSWEDPTCELRGHFVGHYLSALSLAWAGTGSPAFQSRLSLMVSELDKVQRALGLGGYLSAFPPSWFDRVERLQQVWAPYYTIHKLLAGLVDAWELGGQARALPMAEAMVAYHWNRTQALIAKKGDAHWQKVLDFEFGGMSEILYRMYRIKGQPHYLAFAKLFDKRDFLGSMAQGKDTLNDLHANTHLAQVAGFAQGYEVTGDNALRTAVANFFEITTQHHGYATGGTSAFERWQEPDRMAYTFAEKTGADWITRNGLKTHETCTQYNILKLARSLFCWTGDVYYADHYERALVNGMLGVARLPKEDWPEDSHDHPHDHHHHHHHDHHHKPLLAVRSGLLSGGHGNAHLHLASMPRGGAAGAAGGGGGSAAGGSLVGPYTREHDREWMDYPAFSEPRPEWNASDAHGPGVYLYLLPMGYGQSKSDNLHHWGFPFHSFWCCYGTVVESFAKLADSIYFRDMEPGVTHADAGAAARGAAQLPPRLYVNQLVSSQLTWAEAGLVLTQEADMFAPGASITSELRFSRAPAPAPTSPAHPAVAAFTLMLRIPAWTRDGGVSLELNGAPFNDCPGSAVPNTYCTITRKWAPGDRLSVRIAYRWWYSDVQDNRPQFSRVRALMMGPHVMAGLTHADSTLGLPQSAALYGKLAGGGAGHGPERHIYRPGPRDELLSLQAAWNAKLFLRHDASVAYMSEVEDGGDAMDATFRVGRGCFGGGPAAEAAAAGAAGEDAAEVLQGRYGGERSTEPGLAPAFASLRSLMRLGQADAGQALSLEAMGAPNHYLAHDAQDIIVLQPGDATPGQPATPASPCARAQWMMRPGLDGAWDSVSFEAAGRPGWFLTAQAPLGRAPCRDDSSVHCAAMEAACVTSSFVARVLCRRTCGSCRAPKNALRLRELVPGSLAFASASSFRLETAQRTAYPAGAHAIAGTNRHYLVAPLGNLIDERYTAYFEMQPEEEVAGVKLAPPGATHGSAAAGEEEGGMQLSGIRSSVQALYKLPSELRSAARRRGRR